MGKKKLNVYKLLEKSIKEDIEIKEIKIIPEFIRKDNNHLYKYSNLKFEMPDGIFLIKENEKHNSYVFYFNIEKDKFESEDENNSIGASIIRKYFDSSVHRSALSDQTSIREMYGPYNWSDVSHSNIYISKDVFDFNVDIKKEKYLSLFRETEIENKTLDCLYEIFKDKLDDYKVSELKEIVDIVSRNKDSSVEDILEAIELFVKL
jgi:hypothetical protein